MISRKAAYPRSRAVPAPPVDLTDRAVRDRLSRAGVRAFFNIMARWNVRDEDARGLLGGMTNGPYYELKRNPDRVMDVDRLTRDFAAHRHLQGAQHPPLRGAGRPVGPSAEYQQDLRWRHAAGLHAARRSARASHRPAAARRQARRLMRHPPITPLRQEDTHRLVPSRYLPAGDSVLTRVADDDEHLKGIFELDDATNERLLAERNQGRGIGPDELLAAVPLAAVVNAAFAHPHPLGARFNGPDRGAWYAAFDLETAQAEVGFHKTVQLAEIGMPDDSVTFDDYLADFNADFHDLRGAHGFKTCLSPVSYEASQALASDLLENGALGIVYPSVRRDGGTCVACFRPALVGRVRRAKRWRFSWRNGAGPVITRDSRSPAL